MFYFKRLCILQFESTCPFFPLYQFTVRNLGQLIRAGLCKSQVREIYWI